MISYKKIFPIVGHILAAKMCHIPCPLAVRWALTYRCNQQCLYCGIPHRKDYYELDAAGICRMLDDFVRLGTQWISFSGGEPLLRDDLPAIVKHAKKRGFFVTLSTNGRLLPEKIRDLRCVDRIKISLDGPQDVHDRIKGQGSFQKVMEALALCQEQAIPVAVDCVISKFNADVIEECLGIAEARHIPISFQPATIRRLPRDEEEDYLVPADKYRTIIELLIALKKKGARIENSVAGLRHLGHWPVPRSIPCSMGLLSYNVEPNGIIGACIDKSYIYVGRDESQGQESLRTILKNAKPPSSCRECWCGAMVEFNLINSFNLDAIFNRMKYS